MLATMGLMRTRAGSVLKSLFTGLVIPWLIVIPIVGFAVLVLRMGGWFALVCIWLIAWFFFLIAKMTGQIAPSADRLER